MTELERQTFEDGFRICLLIGKVDRARNVLALSISLFDGGRAVFAETSSGSYWNPPDAMLDGLRHCLARVAAPPHILAFYGSICMDLLSRVAATAILSGLRILDLGSAAIALHADVAASAGIEELARSYRLGAARFSDSTSDSVYEDLLWALVAEAGRQDMSWGDLLSAPEANRARPAFERYGFDEQGLRALPDAPGVYVMRDRAGSVLYVGKSGNLHRRLTEYFRPQLRLSPKLERIRDSLQWARVSEELPVERRVEELVRVAQSIALRSPDPGEFRLEADPAWPDTSPDAPA
jgi:hypothetical protein